MRIALDQTAAKRVSSAMMSTSSSFRRLAGPSVELSFAASALLAAVTVVALITSVIGQAVTRLKQQGGGNNMSLSPKQERVVTDPMEALHPIGVGR